MIQTRESPSQLSETSGGAHSRVLKNLYFQYTTTPVTGDLSIDIDEAMKEFRDIGLAAKEKREEEKRKMLLLRQQEDERIILEREEEKQKVDSLYRQQDEAIRSQRQKEDEDITLQQQRWDQVLQNHTRHIAMTFRQELFAPFNAASETSPQTSPEPNAQARQDMSGQVFHHDPGESMEVPTTYNYEADSPLLMRSQGAGGPDTTETRSASTDENSGQGCSNNSSDSQMPPIPRPDASPHLAYHQSHRLSLASAKLFRKQKVDSASLVVKNTRKIRCRMCSKDTRFVNLKNLHRHMEKSHSVLMFDQSTDHCGTTTGHGSPLCSTPIDYTAPSQNALVQRHVTPVRDVDTIHVG